MTYKISRPHKKIYLFRYYALQCWLFLCISDVLKTEKIADSVKNSIDLFTDVQFLLQQLICRSAIFNHARMLRLSEWTASTMTATDSGGVNCEIPCPRLNT